MTEGTKIPSPVSRIIEVLAGDGGENVKLSESMSSAVLNIGAALSAAGVTFGGGMAGGAAALGALAVDARLPNTIGAAQEMDGGRAYT